MGAGSSPCTITCRDIGWRLGKSSPGETSSVGSGRPGGSPAPTCTGGGAFRGRVSIQSACSSWLSPEPPHHWRSLRPAALCPNLDGRLFRCLERPSGDLPIAEGDETGLHNLILLVPLACKDPRVAAAGETHGPGDGLRPIQADLVRAPAPGPAHSRLDLLRDLAGVLAGRIIGCEDGVVTESGDGLADDRTLGLVSLSRTAEHGDDPALGEGPRGCQELLHGGCRVGEVHDHEEILPELDEFEPPRDRGHAF